MDPRDFDAAQRRHLARTERGYRAFVPPPLPAVVRLDGDLARKLSDADRSIGRLAGFASSMPDLTMLSQALLRHEAVLSSRIEGTRASLADLVLFEAGTPAEAGNEDVREVLNYVHAAAHVFAPDRRLPLSIALLCEAHAVLVSGAGAAVTPGEIRRSQNWVGPPGAVIDTATYVPPPPERLWECLDPLEKYLHGQRRGPPLLDIAAVHYQFEAIHPFLDGNGRVGRLLIALLLVEWDLLPGPVLDLSAFIEPRREEYYARLLAVSTDGDWPGWYHFVLDGFIAQSGASARRAKRLLALREDYRVRVATSRASGLLPVLVDELFRVPAITIPRVQELLGVTHRAASQNVAKLVDAGILREVPALGRRRLFLADAVLATVQDGPPPAGDLAADA